MTIENTRLTDINYWLKDYGDLKFEKQGDGHTINVFIKKHIAPAKNVKCIELGSFPGPFLTTLGDLRI